MTPARKVADFLLCKTREHGDWLTNLKLQKLLYYAQGWHLAVYGEPLFGDKIQAWVHGPAVPSVYGQFKIFGWNPIIAEATEPEIDHPVLVEEVLEKYGRFSGLELEQMTHLEPPWILARAGLPPEQQSKNEITPDSMKRFFSSKIKRK